MSNEGVEYTCMDCMCKMCIPHSWDLACGECHKVNVRLRIRNLRVERFDFDFITAARPFLVAGSFSDRMPGAGLGDVSMATCASAFGLRAEGRLQSSHRSLNLYGFEAVRRNKSSEAFRTNVPNRWFPTHPRPHQGGATSAARRTVSSPPARPS